MTIWTNRRGIKIKDLDGDGEDKVIFPPMPYEHSAAGPALTDRIKKPAKGLVMNKGCILARAPGGQMRGAALQAMRCHRRGAATRQMPARRRAPLGCGPQTRRLGASDDHAGLQNPYKSLHFSVRIPPTYLTLFIALDRPSTWRRLPYDRQETGPL